MTTLRARLGAWAERVFPGVEDRAFNRDRDRAVPASVAPKGGYAPPVFVERAPHIVVVPQEGPGFPSWRAGTRNFYFEAWRSAQEQFGAEHVSVLAVAAGEPPHAWHRRLMDHVHSVGATHIVTHIEHDPGSPDAWTWDVLWNALTPTWDGVLLGVMFDSAFPLVTMKARRVARMSPNFVAVDICTSMDDVLMHGRSEVGPVTMPMSSESIELIRDRIADIEPTHDVSFIGVLYPYRLELLEHLRSLGIEVAINPHRADASFDQDRSRNDQPGWLDYMAGLASSRMTINFSRFSSGDAEQLKTRVIEATMAGTLLLTDDQHSTNVYFTPGVEYGYFSNVNELPAVIQAWLSSPDRLDAGRRAAQQKAFSIAHQDFWDRIERGLGRRSLPRLGQAPEA